MQTYITVESRAKGTDESWGMVIGYPVAAKGPEAAFEAAFEYMAINEKTFKNIEYRIGEKQW